MTEAGALGRVPASRGWRIRRRVLLINPVAFNGPCAVVLQSQEDDLAPLHGLQRVVGVVAQVVDVSVPARRVSVRLLPMVVAARDGDGRVGAVGQEWQELALASFQVGRRRVVVRQFWHLVHARPDVCVRVGLVARGVPDVACDDVGPGDGLRIGAVHLARVWQQVG